jgi:hypothetical protein
MVGKKEIKVMGNNHGGKIADNVTLFQELKEIKSDVKELKKFLMDKQGEEEKEQLKKRLIEAYKRETKNKKLQSELSLWDSISSDGL